MKTKNLPHTIYLDAQTVALTAHAYGFTKLTQLMVLLLVSLLTWFQPVYSQTTHPSQQPTPYQPLQTARNYKKKKTIRAAAAISPAATTVAVTAPIAAQPVKAGGSVARGLRLIKQCESGGNYRAVNPAGYYGAYQFNQGTWNSTAGSAGRKDLVGVRPDKASPSDQDAMARKLHSLRGWQPWSCAYHVGLL